MHIEGRLEVYTDPAILAGAIASERFQDINFEDILVGDDEILVYCVYSPERFS